MNKHLLLLSGLIAGVCNNTSASTNNNPSDSLRNEIALSQDRLGYYACSVKFSHRFGKNLWLKTGLVALGNYQYNEPKYSGTTFATTTSQSSFGIILGLDKHIGSKLEGLDFVYGVHSRFFYTLDKYYTANPALREDSRTTKYWYYAAGIGFTFGLYYNLGDRFAIGSELNPYMVYTFQNDNIDNGIRRSGYEFNILQNISLISVRFKWK